MKICRIMKMCTILLAIGITTCFLDTVSVFACCNSQTKMNLSREGQDEEEIQSFEGESFLDSQWDDNIPLYVPKKKVSRKAITTNSFSGRYGYYTLPYEEQRKAYMRLEEAADTFHYSDMDATLVTPSSITGEKKYIAVAVNMDKTVTASAIGEVVASFIYDHPEYFWSKGYSYFLNSAEKDAKVTKVTLACHPDYVDGKKRAELRKNINREIEKYMELIVGISSDYEKELILHDAIAERITYAYDEKHTAQQKRWAHTIEGVFSEKYYSAVCEGYAKAFQLLLNAAGIENVYVVGNAAGQGHAWNQVKIDEEWYNVDITWNDSYDRKNYRYFNLTSTVFGKNHTPFSNLVAPNIGEWCYIVNDCTSDVYSYEKMGDAKEQPSCKVKLGEIQGAEVKILNQGVVVTSGSTLKNSSDFFRTVTTGTALNVEIVPDYTKGEELQIEISINGEKTFFHGIGGEKLSYMITPEEDIVLSISVYVPVQAVKLSKDKLTITGYGKKEKLSAKITPATATNPKITWKSSKPSVAKVKNGEVTSVGAGTATIYAYLEDETVVAKCSVTVKKTYMKIISAKQTVKVGETVNMKAKLYGIAGNIQWMVSNNKVASIGTKSGKLKAKKTGTLWVTAKMGKITAKVKVTVRSNK